MIWYGGVRHYFKGRRPRPAEVRQPLRRSRFGCAVAKSRTTKKVNRQEKARQDYTEAKIDENREKIDTPTTGLFSFNE